MIRMFIADLVMRALGFQRVDTAHVGPELAPEEAAWVERFSEELHKSPTATDDYRNPPPPWLAGV